MTIDLSPGPQLKSKTQCLVSHAYSLWLFGTPYPLSNMFNQSHGLVVEAGETRGEKKQSFPID